MELNSDSSNGEILMKGQPTEVSAGSGGNQRDMLRTH